MNLCIAVIAFSLVFLIGAEKRDFMSKTECSIIAAFIHYFLLTVFTWSIIEAFHSGRGIVFPMKAEISNFWTKSLIFGWGKFRQNCLYVLWEVALLPFFPFIPMHLVRLLCIKVPFSH